MQSCESGESLMSPGKKKDIERNYSDETFYTDSSEDLRSKCKSAATLLQKRRQLRPINGSGNPYMSATRLTTLTSPSKNNVSMISQKIMSAKLLRVKQLQNELTDAHYQLNELANENRMLRTLQKRQEMSLKKYEGTQAELPQLIRSHNEEVRALKAKLKQVKVQCREMENRLKVRESELAVLREQHKHLLKLSKDKHLGEREHLQQQLDQMQEILKEQDKKVQMLTRKAMLEGKNFKHQLTTEVARHKKTTKELDIALERVAQLESILEAKEKYIAVNMGRGHCFQSPSLVSFGNPSRLRLPASFAQANESDGVSGLGGGRVGGAAAAALREVEAELTEGEDASASLKVAALLQQANAPSLQRLQRQHSQRRANLRRQCVQLGPEDDEDRDQEEEDEEDDDYARPALSRESLRYLDHNSGAGFDDELPQQGSNTCPSQVSTTESVENLSKDTTENYRVDDLKLDPPAQNAADPLAEYGLVSESSSLPPRPALRRYSVSGDSSFNCEDGPPSPAAPNAAQRRGSLNGAGDGGGGGHRHDREASRRREEEEEREELAAAVPEDDGGGGAAAKKSASSEEMSVEEGRLHLKTINRTWNDIQSRIKDETKRAQSMIDRFDEDVDLGKYLGNASSSARRTDAYDKNNLLAALKAIDEGGGLDAAMLSDAMERRGGAGAALQCKSKKVEYRTPSQTIDNLHRGLPTRTPVPTPVLDKHRKEHNIFWDGNTSEQIFK